MRYHDIQVECPDRFAMGCHQTEDGWWCHHFVLVPETGCDCGNVEATMAMEQYPIAQHGRVEVDITISTTCGQPCGCDPGCKKSNGTIGHICEHHLAEGHVRLNELHPEFIGAGGPGIYTKTDKPCNQCFPAPSGTEGVHTVQADCDRCFGTGYIHMVAEVRRGVGIIFDCPCGKCGEPCYVPFENPLDDGPPFETSRPMWKRFGDLIDTLTLTPSILRSQEKGGCGWHGYITDGKVVPC